MNPLKAFVEAPLAGAAGWTLLHSLWEGAIIAAALAVVLAAVRSSRTRYAAACVAMLVMLGGLVFTFLSFMPEPAHSLRMARTPELPAWNVRGGMHAVGPSSPGLADVVPWLAPFWIAGVWVFYLRHLAGWVSVCRLRRRGVCCAPEEWRKELACLSARLRLSRPVALLESCLAEVPMVVGHFRPVILMPVELLAGLPAGQIEAVLLHELAHIRRHDYLVNILQRFVEGLLFYHPAVWWVSRTIRTERENCCDDVAVSLTGDAHGYATALAALEQNLWAGREAAVAATGGNLVKRIRRLLQPGSRTGGWSPLAAALILATTAALALAAWQSEQPRSAPRIFGDVAAARAQMNNPNAARYEKWLNEDVVYIITAEERAAFKKLASDEEREKFVEEFWLRRDPVQGAPENAFKTEHYRRIAYANEHFGTSSIPGWKTDRGAVYIVHGAPDEIQTQQMGAPSPYEIWLYSHLKPSGGQLYLRFTDQQMNGEYRLSSEGNSVAGTSTAAGDQNPNPSQGGQQEPTAPIRVEADVQQRKLLTKILPLYPPVAKQAGVQGVVRFAVVIGKDGRVSNVQLVSGHPLLVGAAMDAVRQWVYQPTLLNGEPAEVATQVDLSFTLATLNPNSSPEGQQQPAPLRIRVGAFSSSTMWISMTSNSRHPYTSVWEAAYKNGN